MVRFYNTLANGSSFDSSTIDLVWRKGAIVFGQDPNVVRRDSCGALIKRSEYGNTSSKMGWEIDHVKPVSKGGTDNLDNLQPLQWENNRKKSDDFPYWTCAVKAA